MVAIKPKKTTGGGASKQPAKPKLLKTKADKQAAVLEALEEGYTMRSAAAWGGICERTLRDWRKADPDFGAAVEESRAFGRQKRAEEIAEKLYEAAMEVADDPRYTTCAIFALKNLDPKNWRDRHEIAHEHGGVNIQVNLILHRGEPDVAWPPFEGQAVEQLPGEGDSEEQQGSAGL